MRAKRMGSEMAERLDEHALVRIVMSRAKEVGVAVGIDALSGRLPHLQTAQIFAGLQNRDRPSGLDGSDLKEA